MSGLKCSKIHLLEFHLALHSEHVQMLRTKLYTPWISLQMKNIFESIFNQDIESKAVGSYGEQVEPLLWLYYFGIAVLDITCGDGSSFCFPRQGTSQIVTTAIQCLFYGI